MKKLASAAKLDVVLSLYSDGFLCKCNNYEEVIEEGVYGQVYRKELRHKRNCEGRIKAQELLNDESLNDG